MADDVRINIGTYADTKGAMDAQKGVDEVGNSAERAGEKAKKAGFDFAEFGKNASLGASAILGAGAAFVGFGAQVAGNLESARQGFVAILGSAEKADAVMARVKREAAATPFEIPGLVTGTQALAAVTKDGDKAVDMLMNVGKAIATSGKGQAELDRVIFNLQQISSTGKVTEMDIRQFQNAIPIFNDVLASVGTTADALKEAKDPATVLALAFETAGKKGGIAAEGFTSQAGTFNQLISNMKDNFTIFASDIVTKSGMFDVLKQALSGLIEFMTVASPQVIAFMQAVAGNPEALTILAGIIGGLLVAAAVGLVVAFGPMILAAGAFAAAGAGLAIVLRTLWPVISTVTTFIREHHEAMVGLIVFIAVLAIPTIAGLVAGMWTFVVSLVTGVIPAMIAAAIPFLPLILIAAALAVGIALLMKAWETNFFGIRDITEKVINFIIGMINNVIDKINALLSAINTIAGTDFKLSKINMSVDTANWGGPAKTNLAPSSSPVAGPSNPFAGLNSSMGGNNMSIIQNNVINTPIDQKKMISDLTHKLNTK